jgi:predicted HTH transcriptional regulator
MSIFTKPVSEIGTADLQELLQDAAVENARLEFKLQVPAKDETLKKLSSFANTFGGFMVIGASASSADGRIDGLPGVDVEAGYKQKVVDWCFSAVSPPLMVEVSDPVPVPAGGKKVCYVVRTEESDVAPHFLNGRKGIWVRTDEFSARFEARLANDTELRHLLNRRQLIRERRANLLERAKRDSIHTLPS